MDKQTAIQEIGYIGARLREKSTYGGLAMAIGFVFALWRGNITIDPTQLADALMGLGMSLGALAAIFFPEKSVKAAIIVGAMLSAALLGEGWLSPAFAGDINAPAVTLPVKAPASLPASPTCSIAGCQGLEAGGNFTGSGTGVSVANLGSLNAGGSYFGGEANYMTYNGTYLLGVGGKVEYEAANPPTAIVGGAFSNKLFAFEYVEAGGALSNIFNIAPVTLPGFLSNAVPSARIGACQHGPMQGICSSFHARLFIPNSRWTVNADYTNAQYNSGTALAPGVTGNTENRGSLGVTYHF